MLQNIFNKFIIILLWTDWSKTMHGSIYMMSCLFSRHVQFAKYAKHASASSSQSTTYVQHDASPVHPINDAGDVGQSRPCEFGRLWFLCVNYAFVGILIRVCMLNTGVHWVYFYNGR